jgi:ribosomal protein S18 acetylase RimI-like enzyme
MRAVDTGADLLVPDAWLTETLGVATFSLRAAPVAAPLVRAALDSLGGGNVFVFTKVPTADVAHLTMLESCGFNLVDTQVTLRHHEHASPAAHPARIRVAVPADRVAVGDIAEGCFRYSRFHQDPKIEPAIANRVKRRWAENCVAGVRGEEVLLASLDGNAAGFLAVVLSGEAATIDLIGVEPRMQGNGIGRALVQAFVARWRPKAKFLRVGTQISNAASQRLYQRCGFFFEGAQYVLHTHRPEGA